MKRGVLVAIAVVTLMATMLVPADAVTPVKSVKFSCKTTGTAMLDPIVVPNGGPSMHEHLFAGNTGIPKGVHDYDTAIAQTTTCKFAGDSAGYWVPTYRNPDGTLVPAKVTVYYDKMTSQTIVPFPPDFGKVFGPGALGLFSPKQRSYGGWNCENTEPLQPTYEHVDCRGMPSNAVVTFRAFSPYCWDGIDPGVRNYGNHVFYPDNYPTNAMCPAGAIVLPRLRVNFNFQTQYCPDCVFSSDEMAGVSYGASAHTDFWNTWDQQSLENLVKTLNQ